jgi:hypothetical protein
VQDVIQSMQSPDEFGLAAQQAPSLRIGVVGDEQSKAKQTEIEKADKRVSCANNHEKHSRPSPLRHTGSTWLLARLSKLWLWGQYQLTFNADQ